MNSSQSKTYWLLYQLRRLHRRYRFRKMMLMMIPFTLIVAVYMGIQFKDLYQLKHLKISNQVAATQQDVEAEIEAPFAELASEESSSSINSVNNAFDVSEKEEVSANTTKESMYLADEDTFDLFTKDVKEEKKEIKEEKDAEFIAGLTQPVSTNANNSINMIDLSKITTEPEISANIKLPKASPTLLAFKPVPYVRLFPRELFSEVAVEENDDALFQDDFGTEDR